MLRHDFALKLPESSEPRPEPESFEVTINGMCVWSCSECRLIFTRFKYGINSDFYVFCHIHRHLHTRFQASMAIFFWHFFTKISCFRHEMMMSVKRILYTLIIRLWSIFFPSTYTTSFTTKPFCAFIDLSNFFYRWIKYS